MVKCNTQEPDLIVSASLLLYICTFVYGAAVSFEKNDPGFDPQPGEKIKKKKGIRPILESVKSKFKF